ncbi:electron transfer flavoprotein beta subunit [Geoalkalibacter ferrihydriticus]|uniref:Electron transfer flavoprotein subunit beta n=2 Tax=Geoalkalibacter ferrihydriticus TaxID=392333 RepID=A0A0C2HZD4_9BACT|nr:electron transfer flavoprotein subunit beta [Geoalkalibacter ferrihydriticus]KIH78087.1 electron transfer flavoprotein subunit beta [Geoalkalibacter ferrihydriticus DSM 17813]SDM77563.1 electron transfer flavoprotein beta subunit [Geoalkalibacter ferrihydriticus]
MAQNKLEILVIIRECSDPRPPVRLMAKGAGIRDRGLRRLVNPADLEALEHALALKDAGVAKVTAAALGPSHLDDSLRLALAMGVERAIRIWDGGLDGGDAVADAHLWQRLFSILRPDLILTGNRLLDCGCDPAPALAAARQGLGCVSAALSLQVNTPQVEILRKGDRGARQKILARLPCAILCESGFKEIRYPALEAVMDALSRPIEAWGLSELGLASWEVGGSGSVLEPGEFAFPRPDPLRSSTPDPSLPAFERILALLSGGIQPREGKMHFLPPEEVADNLLQIFHNEGLLPEARP